MRSILKFLDDGIPLPFSGAKKKQLKTVKFYLLFWVSNYIKPQQGTTWECFLARLAFHYRFLVRDYYLHRHSFISLIQTMTQDSAYASFVLREKPSTTWACLGKLNYLDHNFCASFLEFLIVDTPVRRRWLDLSSPHVVNFSQCSLTRSEN